MPLMNFLTMQYISDNAVHQAVMDFVLLLHIKMQVNTADELCGRLHICCCCI